MSKQAGSNMSWKQVDEEMAKMEQIVQSIEDQEEEQTIRPCSEPVKSLVEMRPLGARPKERKMSSEKAGKLKTSSPTIDVQAAPPQPAPPAASVIKASYRRFSSPRPPNLKLERKMSAGILRTTSSAEPTSPAPSFDRLSVTFAMDENGAASAADAEKTETEEAKNQAENYEAVLEKNEEIFGAEIGSLITESGEEYAESLMQIYRSKSKEMIGRKSSTCSNIEEMRKQSEASSGIFFVENKQQSSRRRQSSSVSILSSSRSRSRSSAVSKGDADTIKLHKEVIEMAKYQMWPLDKKLRVTQQAKDYVQKHQSEMDERLAQSKTFASRLTQFKLMLSRFFSNLWKWLRDFLANVTPWQKKIKDIESHFGSVVSSYFVFLRWIFWMNFFITLVLVVFVIIPEVLAADWQGTGARKNMLPVEQLYAYNLKIMWDFEGILRYSPIFYGYYSDAISTKAGYRIPLAYFCAGMAVYIFSFAIILKKMAQNNKQSKLSEKGDECNFTWRVFTSWDYGIANVETAHNKVASITMGFREALVDEMEKDKELAKSWRVIAKRIIANFLVILFLGGSAYAVIFAVHRSEEPEADSSWYRQNEITIVMSLIGSIVPNAFDVISLLEDYHPRKAMRWMLARIMALNLLSLYTLIYALFGKTDGMIDSLMKMEQMKNDGINFGIEPITSTYEPPRNCYIVPLPCNILDRANLQPPLLELQIDDYFINETLSLEEAIETLDFYEKKANDTPILALNTSQNCPSCGADGENQTEIPEINIVIRGDQEDAVTLTTESSSTKATEALDTDCVTMRRICQRRFYGTKRPPDIPAAFESCSEVKSKYIQELKEKIKLRKLCWETMFGQELVKLTVMDTVFTVMSIIVGDFGRSLVLRVLNPCWFWDLEAQFPKYPDFKVAENILHLVNNQGMIWMGLFMAPGLPAINLVKLAIIMYSRAWAVMTTNVPHETVFRASRSNNFYFVLLLVMLFLCTLPVAYAIVWLKPSWHCGPFASHDRMFKVFTEKVMDILPKKLHGTLDYITSPGIVIPTFVLLVLIIYYLISLTGLLRESNEDLKNQLHHERTEERRKLVKGGKSSSADSTANIHEKWKRVLGSALSNSAIESKKSIDETDVEKAEENEASKPIKKLLDTKKLLQRPLSELSFQSVNEISSMGEPVNEEGSLCNTFNIETTNAAVEMLTKKKETPPPKIWISKSASMDDELEENKEEANHEE